MTRQLVLGALWVAFWIGLAWAVSPALDQLDARTPQPWTVPPSAIVAITTAPGAQQPNSTQSATAGQQGSGAAASPRLPRWSAEPKPVMKLGRVTMPASPTPGAAASHSLAELVRVGTASNMGPAFPPAYLALPGGPGWIARICGPGGCVTRISTDTGPERWTHRVADLSVHDFEAVCGCGWRTGLVTVSVILEGRRP